MISNRISGCTRVCGKAQGYIGLPIRDIMLNLANGEKVPAMLTSWQPTPKELDMLIAGGAIYIMICGTQPPPMRVDVQPLEEAKN